MRARSDSRAYATAVAAAPRTRRMAMARRRRRLGLDLAALWPGQMSFDSAFAWWQARGGATTDIVPPAFVLAWRALRPIADGPQAMFAGHLAVFRAASPCSLRA